MKVINIVKPFLLSHNDGSKHHFGPGQHEVEDDVADHWYVKIHTDNPPSSEPPMGTPEYAQKARKARRKLLTEDAGDDDKED